ncbi:MAG: E3 binding domain-containing protein, partial [Acidobacteriaceae bacterium]|nr:E3 binding domain-containing protein [Acidobacteriaceae bacterium]
MPQMGESIVEGTLTRWLKKPGDKVERDEPLFEISTDKVDTEIPSPVAGVLGEILVQEGTTVAINSVVARIGEGDGAGSSPAPAAAPAAAPPQQAPQPSMSTPPSVDVGPSAASRDAVTPPPPPAPSSAGPYPIEPPPSRPTSRPAPPPPTPVTQPDGAEEQGPLSPLVRKMAREYNIDLSQVRGTGAGGRITKQDLEAYMSSQAARTYSAPAAPPQPAASAAGPYPVQPASQPVQPGAPPPPLPLAETAKVRTEPMSNMRQKIAEHMVMS